MLYLCLVAYSKLSKADHYAAELFIISNIFTCLIDSLSPTYDQHFLLFTNSTIEEHTYMNACPHGHRN